MKWLITQVVEKGKLQKGTNKHFYFCIYKQEIEIITKLVLSMAKLMCVKYKLNPKCSSL